MPWSRHLIRNTESKQHTHSDGLAIGDMYASCVSS